MSRHILYLGLFSIFFLFLISSAFADITFTATPNTIYSDSENIILQFTIPNLVTTEKYDFVLINPHKDNYIFSGSSNYCSVGTCNNYLSSTNTYDIVGGVTGLDLNYHLSLITAPIESQIFECSAIPEGTSPLVKCPSSVQIEVISGNPSFSISIYDVNAKSVSSSLPKNSSFKVLVNDLKDNIDDTKGEYISCNYSIAGTSKTETSNNWAANLTEQDKEFSVVNASDLGSGTYTLNVTCEDGALNDAKSTTFKIEDKLPQVDSITFTPSNVYPETKVKCDAVVSDPDDSVVDKTFNWIFKGVTTTNNTNEFDCSLNKCVSGDSLACKVTPKNNSQTGQAVPKELKVDSHFTSIAISSASKLQVGQEETFNATINYNGTNAVTYSWSFGDGSTATGQSAKHSYTSKGEYTVTLTVSDSKGSTSTETTIISVVDADLVILIKNPIANQEISKGEKLTVKASLNDNTGTAISDANVIAKLKSGDLVYDTVQMIKVTNSPGLYEGTLTIKYNVPNNAEVEISAISKSMTNKKINPIILTAIDSILPIITLNTSYTEAKENSLSVGNTINSINICFKMPDSSFDDTMQGKVIISAFKDYEFKLDELDSKCYNIYPDYKILKEDLDSGLTIKFKDVKDSYGNFVKASSLKTFSVLALPKMFDLVLISPNNDKLNVGQIVNVKVRAVIKDNLDIKNLKAQIVYKGKTYNLENSDSEDYVFQGSFLPDTDPEINFKVYVNGSYNGALAEEYVSKTLFTTNDLVLETISPSDSGVINNFGKIILAIKYQNDELYSEDSVELNVNDNKTLFTKITDGKYAGYFSADSDFIGFLKSIDLSIKGEDEKGNLFKLEKSIPTMAWKLPLYVYYILLGILVLFILIGVIVKIIFRKQNAIEKEFIEKSKGKDLDQLNSELAVAKQMLGELARKFMKQEISEETFKTQKIEWETKKSVLQSQIAVLEKQETKILNKAKSHIDGLSEEKKDIYDKKVSLESDVFSKYKDDIDDLTNKLKPYRDKYSKEDMVTAIKQSKELPDSIIDKIIEKIYD